MLKQDFLLTVLLFISTYRYIGDLNKLENYSVLKIILGVFIGMVLSFIVIKFAKQIINFFIIHFIVILGKLGLFKNIHKK